MADPPVASRSTDRADTIDSTARRLVPIAAVAMIVPVWVAVLRVGLRHLVPVGDTAIMALRAPDVLSRHPPLIGMPASSASTADQVVHFPGALQLYWLAVPVKVLGATWGTVVAMGALNTIWILLAAWLIHRMLTPAATLAVYSVLSVFWWALGSGMLIDSWPLLMVVVPFVTVLVAAWAAACGDGRALVVLAVAANYVWLDHLVLGLLAPLVALAGCVGYLVWYRLERRAGPEAGRHTQRTFRRYVGIAGAVTVVMWIPTLVEQLTHTPGNLRLLLSGSDGAPAAVRSPTAAIHVVASLVGRPPFWLRGTIADPTFYRADPTARLVGSMTWGDLVIVIVVALLVGSALTVAVWRRDRVVAWSVIVAVVATAGGLATVYLAPDTTAVVPEYLYSLWAVAMFVWSALVVTVVRTVRSTASRTLARGAFGVVVVFAVLNLPASATGYTGHPADTRVARDMIDTVVPEVAEQAPVGVRMENIWAGSANTLSALLVGLRDGGVAFCYPTPNTSLYEFIDDCDGSEGAVVVLAERTDGGRPAGRVLFDRRVFPGAPDPRTDDTDRTVRAWLGNRSKLALTDAAQRPFLGALIPRVLRAGVAGFTPSDGNLAALADDGAFWDTIITFYARSGNRDAPLFVDQPVGNDELYRWATRRHRHHAVQWATRQPPA